jgi:enoyl-CoA hydratase/carnithine racemase
MESLQAAPAPPSVAGRRRRARNAREDRAVTFEATMRVEASHADGRLLAGRIEDIGVVLFNQPEKRNAISLAMWDGIRAALDSFANDEGVRAVIYAGAGDKAFTAGADISEFATRRDGAEANAEYARIGAGGRKAMTGFPKPTIACIQGSCIGGGLGMALNADIRVASAGSVFGVPAARRAIAYGIEPMEQLVRHVGPGNARLILFTGRSFTAEEALGMGLIEVLAKADAAEAAIGLAREIAANAPLSLRALKFTLGEVPREPARRDAAAMEAMMRACMDSPDYRESHTAFMEKRKPAFAGR